jgi:hypothetical protein
MQWDAAAMSSREDSFFKVVDLELRLGDKGKVDEDVMKILATDSSIY